VSQSMAVLNPLARDIVDAVAGLGVKVAFEPGKTHPKDWANPGRVKVFLKEPGRRTAVKNSTSRIPKLSMVNSSLRKLEANSGKMQNIISI
jgi:signal recognition particle subunit SEC65